MHESRHAALKTFVDWCAKHLTDDEKGEAQIFLDRLFQAFDYWTRLAPSRPESVVLCNFDEFGLYDRA